MNCVINSSHLELLQPEIEYFLGINYDLNRDAIWKWASVWRTCKELDLLKPGISCLDIGGGYAPLQYVFSNYGVVNNIDGCLDPGGEHHRGNWFPIDSDGIYVESRNISFNAQNLNRIAKDFHEGTREIDSESIDFAYDCCSMIHFDSNQAFSRNDGVTRAMEEIHRVLKPGGIFISASDVDLNHNAYPGHRLDHFGVDASSLGGCFASSRLEFISDPVWDYEPFFTSDLNYHRPVANAPEHLKGTREYCSNHCKHLPEFHLLGEMIDDCATARCLYTLRKPIEPL